MKLKLLSLSCLMILGMACSKETTAVEEIPEPNAIIDFTQLEGVPYLKRDSVQNWNNGM